MQEADKPKWTVEQNYTPIGGKFDLIRFSADSRFAVVGHESACSLLDVQRGSLQFLTTGSHDSSSIAFSADGQMIALATAKVAEVWSVYNCRVLRRIRTGGPPVSIAFNPVNGLIAVGCSDGVIELREPETGVEVGRMNSLGSEVQAVDFRCDGTVLASGDFAGRVLLWDVAALRLLGEVGTHANACIEVRFSPDGALLASRGASEDFVILWNAANLEVMRSITGLSDVLGMYFTSEGGMIIVFRRTNCHRDAVATLVPVDPSRPEILVRAFEDGEWLAFDNSGRVAASEYGTPRIGWRLGDQLFRVKTLWDEFFVQGLHAFGEAYSG